MRASINNYNVNVMSSDISTSDDSGASGGSLYGLAAAGEQLSPRLRASGAAGERLVLPPGLP